MDEDVQQLLQRRRYAEALEQLLNRYETKVFRMALVFLKDPTRAEDVAQDIFLKLWQALPDYDGCASPGAWLDRIARNTCLSAWRSDSYRKPVPLDAAIEPAAPIVSQADDRRLSHYVNPLTEI